MVNCAAWHWVRRPVNDPGVAYSVQVYDGAGGSRGMVAQGPCMLFVLHSHSWIGSSGPSPHRQASSHNEIVTFDGAGVPVGHPTPVFSPGNPASLSAKSVQAPRRQGAREMGSRARDTCECSA